MYYGSFDRTCWVDNGIAPNPRATDTNGYLYEHELGFDEDVEPFNSYIQTGDFDLSEGKSLCLWIGLYRTVYLLEIFG